MFTKYQKFFLPVVAVLVLLGLAYFSLNSVNKQQNTVYDLQVSSEEHIKGNPQAQITLVEYGDFQCPACGAYYPIVKQLLNDFPDDLRIVYRHFPLTTSHKNALPAARAAEAAGLQGKFWEMHDLLFGSQNEWSNLVDPKEKFVEYAESLELDQDKFLADYESSEVQDLVSSDADSAASLGLTGTPTFFVDGQRLENPRGYEAFKKIVNDAISN